MFEKATRQKLRFFTDKGQLTVEDLWDLPLESSTGRVNLDTLCVDLLKQLNTSDTVSFVKPGRKSNATIQLKFDIVKHVIEVRLAENAAANLARSNAEKKQELLAVVANRQRDDLQKLTTEDLLKQIEALG